MCLGGVDALDEGRGDEPDGGPQHGLDAERCDPEAPQDVSGEIDWRRGGIWEHDVCRLVVKHHGDLARWRNKLCCRLHALVAELVPGGISKEVVVNQARSLLEGVEPAGAVAVERHRLAVEFVAEIDHLDIVLRDTRARVTGAVTASGTTLREIFGVGPIVAGMLIGYTGDPLRFSTASRYAAYTGTAPVEFSSGGRIVHRLSRRGSRKLNHALHIAAITQSATRTASDAATTTASSPRATHLAKRSARRSAVSATSPGATSSPTPNASPPDDERVRAGQMRTTLAPA